MTLWHGRFGADPAAELLAYNNSLPVDQRLAAEDIAGSRAHVRGLVRGGLLDEEEGTKLLEALDQVAEEFESGGFTFVADEEDIHTAVERRVTEIAGDTGARLHTGRSRNDQVATDLRLWTKRSLGEVASRLVALQRVFYERARKAGDIYLPGYTHLQRAQPVLLAHHLLAHGWALARDVDRLLDARRRLDVSPLGAGALAGSSLPLDPDAVAADLGFSGRFDNSLDAVSDRDFVAESLFDLALVGIHLSRVGEELVLWSSEEFGFCSLDDAYATGSSMLPQKKNPDIAELVRGKAGRLIGDLTGLLATLKGVPLAYNKDLQEDKEPLFDAVDQVNLGVSALAGMLASVTWHGDRMRAAADGGFVAAVDLAEWMVERGMPFRKAHAEVGGLVRESLDKGVPLKDLVRAHPSLGHEAVELLEPGAAVTRRSTPGGAGPGPVAGQLAAFANCLDEQADRIAAGRAPESGVTGRAPESGVTGRAPESGVTGRAPGSGVTGRAPGSGTAE